MTLIFELDEPVRRLGVEGVYFLLEGFENREKSEEFEELKKRELDRLIAQLRAGADLEIDPLLRGFRDLHELVGASARDVSSPESLLRQLLRTGTLPTINLLVDIYNLISARSRLALGAHDVARIQGAVTLRMTTGDERFTPLGLGKNQRVRPGEYAYVDGAGDVLCRMEVRQVEKTKVTISTESAFFIIQGHRRVSLAYFAKTFRELTELAVRFCGGEVNLLYAPWV